MCFFASSCQGVDAHFAHEPKKRVLPKVSMVAPIERGYYEDLVRLIDGDEHFNRLGNSDWRAVPKQIDLGMKENPPVLPGPEIR